MPQYQKEGQHLVLVEELTLAEPAQTLLEAAVTETVLRTESPCLARVLSHATYIQCERCDRYGAGVCYPKQYHFE